MCIFSPQNTGLENNEPLVEFSPQHDIPLLSFIEMKNSKVRKKIPEILFSKSNKATMSFH